MAMEDIKNSEFISGSYDGSFLMYGSSPTPNANIGQPEAAAANANTAHPQSSNMATYPGAIEADQTQEPLLEPEETVGVANYGGHYIDIRDLNKKIAAKKRNIRREQEEVEELEEIRHQLLQGNHPPEQWQQRQLRLAQRKIVNQMLFLAERGIVDGYVYGLVPKGKDPVFAVCENLRSWWEEEAKFDRKGPIAIFRYNTSSSGPFTHNINLDSLMEIHDATLESLASALMQQCDPPQRCYPFDKGVAPPWWPTGNEEWWGEVAQLDGMSVPRYYRKPHCLQKQWKVSILVAMVKHLIANDHHPLIIRCVRESKSLQKKMTARDSLIWSAYIEHELNIYLGVNPPFANMISWENGGSNNQLIPLGGGGGGSSSMDYGHVNLGDNKEGAQEASMPTFLLNQSPQQVLAAQAAAGNELYDVKGKTVISNDPTLYRPRQETGLFINDTPMIEGQVIPDTHPNLNPLNVTDYGVKSFPNDATGCSDWQLSSVMTDQQSNTDDIDWLFNFE